MAVSAQIGFIMLWKSMLQ